MRRRPAILGQLCAALSLAGLLVLAASGTPPAWPDAPVAPVAPSVLAAVAAPPAAPRPQPAPVAPAALAPPGAAAPKLLPLPPALERRMGELVHAAERYRGLTLKRRVPWGRVSEPELRREIAADFQEDLPPARLAAVELSLKAFGFIPESMDLATYYPELLTSQIAGFYDPHRKALAVVDRDGGLLGKEVTAQFGAELVRKMEDGLLVHELTHALQDQHFDLDRLNDPDPLSDSGVARLALVEGDASLVMLDELVQAPLEQLPEARNLVSEMLADSAGAASPDRAGKLPGEKEMAAAPPWFRDMLLFSYSQGAAFCLEVRQHGGQKLLDYAFATDPPRSSEQILHPEKWYGHRDDPVAIVWPELGDALPGYAKAAEGQLGEEGMRVLLRPALEDAARAAAAAAGWGGDRFAIYVRGGGAGRRLLVWIADWDTAEDAARFQAAALRLARISHTPTSRGAANRPGSKAREGSTTEAYSKYVEGVDPSATQETGRFPVPQQEACEKCGQGQGWLVTRAAPRRVTLLRGERDGIEVPGLLTRLAAARAAPPANHDIDLARIAPRAPRR